MSSTVNRNDSEERVSYTTLILQTHFIYNQTKKCPHYSCSTSTASTCVRIAVARRSCTRRDTSTAYSLAISMQRRTRWPSLPSSLTCNIHTRVAVPADATQLFASEAPFSPLSAFSAWSGWYCAGVRVGVLVPTSFSGTSRDPSPSSRPPRGREIWEPVTRRPSEREPSRSKSRNLLNSFFFKRYVM